MLCRVGVFGAAVVDFGEAANRREVFRGGAEHVFELVARLLEAAKLQQRSAQRHARGKVGRVALQPGFAGRDRILELPGTPVFLGERGERD